MIKLKPLINMESVSAFQPNAGQRSIMVNKEKGESLLNVSFNKFNQESYKFYRKTKSMPNWSPDFMLVVPSKIERSSKDTSNLYYVLFDNLPSWRGYPSRSKSIIFTNRISVTNEYSGNLCRVYPMNNAKIAFGIYDEAFLELRYAFDRMKASSLPSLMMEFDSFFLIINRLIRSDGYKLNKIPNTLTLKNSDYDGFLEILEQIPNQVIKKMSDDYNHPIAVDLIQHKKGSWEEYFDDLFNPQKNNIRLFTGDNFDDSISYEFWTNSPCLLKRHTT